MKYSNQEELELLNKIFDSNTNSQQLYEPIDTEQALIDLVNQTSLSDNHTIAVCSMCGLHIKCGVCGNNCCNGGSGRTVKDADCDCNQAYSLQTYWLEVPCSYCDSNVHDRLHCATRTQNEQILKEIFETK